MSGQAARSPAGGGEYMSIGEVLAQLRGEFPDVTISKIRFLESEGLIEPQRSPSGYRKFSHADVDRLRFILTAQRDRYLPLRVIKEQLDAYDQDGPRPRVVGADHGDVRLTRAELLDSAEIDDELLVELEEFGLIGGDAGRDGRRFGADALTVARSAGVLSGFGLHPRHLRAVKASAEREVGLVDQAVAPLFRQRSPGARDRAGESAREIAGHLIDLHAALVRAGVQQISGS